MMEIYCIIAGFIAYFILAMQPKHFLSFIPDWIGFYCFPCYSFWLSFLIHLPLYFLIDINILMLFPVGAVGYLLFKFLE